MGHLDRLAGSAVQLYTVTSSPPQTSTTMDKLTEAQLGDYMGILKTNDASLDLKISCINELKYSIKHYHVPDFTVSATFDLIRTAMVSQHSALAATGFSALGHLFKRLSIQEPKHIAIHGPRMLPAVLDRLGDQRERLRALATQCLGDLWKACPQEVERAIRDSAMVSKNPRTKEAAMHWILQVCPRVLRERFMLTVINR